MSDIKTSGEKIASLSAIETRCNEIQGSIERLKDATSRMKVAVYSVTTPKSEEPEDKKLVDPQDGCSCPLDGSLASFRHQLDLIYTELEDLRSRVQL